MNKTIWISFLFAIAGLYQGCKIFALESTNKGHSDFLSNIKLLTEYTLPIDSVPNEEEPEFAGGIGTEDDPWLIETAYHLNNVRNYLGPCSDKYYKQIADIDLGTSPWNMGEGWLPIGYHSAGSFRGFYDGNGHVISGLFINRPMDWDLGLFGETSGAEIKNLGIVDANITGRYSIGALVGENYLNSTISNCYSTGIINSTENYAGGLVGSNDLNCIITHSYSICNVRSTGNYVGGLAGCNARGSTITNSYSKGNVKGEMYTGGLTGNNAGNVVNSFSTGSVTGGEYYSGGLVGSSRGLIQGCYSTGDVLGNFYVGGLLGNNQKSLVLNCYSTGRVTGYLKVGGLVGINRDATITNSYSTGYVTGSNDYQGYYVGGLVGDNAGGTVNQGFWDIVSSGTSQSDRGQGLCSWEMTFQELYINWDFTEIWDIEENNTYPFLRWQIEPEEFNHPIKNNIALNISIENSGFVSGGGDYFPCEPVKISAIANEQFVFVNWTTEAHEVISTKPEFVFTMHGDDITLTANFLFENSVREASNVHLKVYPNPASDFIHVKSTHRLKIIRVTNSVGLVVQTYYPDDLDMDINVSRLKPGFYFLHIHSDTTLFTHKFSIY